MSFDHARVIQKKSRMGVVSPSELLRAYGLDKVLQLDDVSGPGKIFGRLINKEDPSKPVIVQSLTELFASLKLNPLARFDDLGDLYATNARALEDYEFGLQYREAHLFLDAAFSFKAALRRDPDFIMAAIRLAQCRFILGEFGECLILTDPFLAGPHPSLLEIVAEMRYKALLLMGERERAQVEWERAIKRAESQAMIHQQIDLLILAASSREQNGLSTDEAWDLTLSALKLSAEIGSVVRHRQAVLTAAYIATIANRSDLLEPANIWLDQLKNEIDQKLFPEHWAAVQFIEAAAESLEPTKSSAYILNTFDLADQYFSSAGFELRSLAVRLKKASFLIDLGAVVEAETLVLRLKERLMQTNHFRLNIEADITLAQIEQARGNIESAAIAFWSVSEKIYRKSCIALSPRVNRLLFPCLLQLGWFKLAYDLSEKQLSHGSLDRLMAESLSRHGDILFLSGNPDEAVWYYEAALEVLDPSGPVKERTKIIRQIAHARIWTGSVDKGERVLAVSREWDPDHPDNVLILAHLKYKVGRIDEALALMKQIKTDHPCQWSKGHEFLLRSWAAARSDRANKVGVWLPHYL